MICGGSRGYEIQTLLSLEFLRDRSEFLDPQAQARALIGSLGHGGTLRSPPSSELVWLPQARFRRASIFFCELILCIK